MYRRWTVSVVRQSRIWSVTSDRLCRESHVFSSDTTRTWSWATKEFNAPYQRKYGTSYVFIRNQASCNHLETLGMLRNQHLIIAQLPSLKNNVLEMICFVRQVGICLHIVACLGLRYVGIPWTFSMRTYLLNIQSMECLTEAPYQTTFKFKHIECHAL